MSKVALVTDSTSYIPQNLVLEYEIHVVPQVLIWGEEIFEDGIDIMPNEFYSSKTSKPIEACVLCGKLILSDSEPYIIEKAFKNLKKKMAFEGIFKELKRRRYYEKPSVEKKRKREEAERRRLKKIRRMGSHSTRTTRPQQRPQQ